MLKVRANNEKHYLLIVNDDSYVDEELNVVAKHNFDDIASLIAKKL